MHNLKKLFLWISLAYIVLALIFFALNGISLIKGVSRHAPIADCAKVGSSTLKTNDPLFLCEETADLRWGHHFTWISWQFFSNNRGYDHATYVPVDVILLALVNASVLVVSRRKH